MNAAAVEFPPDPASPSCGCNADADVCSITYLLPPGCSSASKSLERASWSGCTRTTSGDLALAVRCDDDGSGSDWYTGPAIGADAGGGANGEGETDADVDATPRPTAGGAGPIRYCDAVRAGTTTGAAVTNGDLDF